MTPGRPEFKILKFKDVVDEAAFRFFQSENDSFSRTADGRYVYSGDCGKLDSFMTAETKTILRGILRPFDITRPEYYFVTDGCEPRDNALLGIADAGFPASLRRYAWSDACLKYFLRERDLLVDERMLNCAAARAFQRAFADMRQRNAIFVRHRIMGCDVMRATLGKILGESLCSDVAACRQGRRPCVMETNDLISKYVKDKTGLRLSRKYADAFFEVKQFVLAKMEHMQNGVTGEKQA